MQKQICFLLEFPNLRRRVILAHCFQVLVTNYHHWGQLQLTAMDLCHS